MGKTVTYEAGCSRHEEMSDSRVAALAENLARDTEPASSGRFEVELR